MSSDKQTTNALKYLGKSVKVVIDRPIGSKHPKHGFEYKANYGYIPNTLSPDGEELDAYYLGVNKPLNSTVGICAAVIRRLDDDDDKLVVTPEGSEISDKEVEEQTHFQEKWFKYKIIRQKKDSY